MKIHDLTLEERIKLVEDIWDSIAAEQEALPLTSEQKSPRDHRVGATIIAHSGSATCPLPSGRGSDFPVSPSALRVSRRAGISFRQRLGCNPPDESVGSGRHS